VSKFFETPCVPTKWSIPITKIKARPKFIMELAKDLKNQRSKNVSQSYKQWRVL